MPPHVCCLQPWMQAVMWFIAGGCEVWFKDKLCVCGGACISINVHIKINRWVWKAKQKQNVLHLYSWWYNVGDEYVLLFLLVWMCVCVFTSAMLELHLLFIGVLLGFDVSAVPEKKCTAGLWSCIDCFSSTQTPIWLYIAPLWAITYSWVCMCNGTRALNLWYFQENPPLLCAHPTAVCMKNRYFLLSLYTCYPV